MAIKRRDYRGERRNRAKVLKLVWRTLPRKYIDVTNGRTKVVTTQIYVPVPHGDAPCA